MKFTYCHIKKTYPILNKIWVCQIIPEVYITSGIILTALFVHRGGVSYLEKGGAHFFLKILKRK